MGHNADNLIRCSLQQAINEVTVAEGSQYQARETISFVAIIMLTSYFSPTFSHHFVPQPLNYEFFGGEFSLCFDSCGPRVPGTLPEAHTNA